MIRMLVAVILILVVLGLFGVSVQEDIVENEQVQENTSYVWSGVAYVWHRYLEDPFIFIWRRIIVDILWEGFRINMERLRDGELPTDFQSMDTSAIPNIPQLIDNYNANH